MLRVKDSDICFVRVVAGHMDSICGHIICQRAMSTCYVNMLCQHGMSTWYVNMLCQHVKLVPNMLVIM